MTISTQDLRLQISRFLAYQLAHRPKELPNLTCDQLCEQAPVIGRQPLEAAFGSILAGSEPGMASAEAAEYLKRHASDTIRALNEMSGRKRFLTLQTIDLFSEESVFLRFAEMLLVKDIETQKALASLLLNTFMSTHAVINILKSRNDIYSPATIESEKAALYVFEVDLARTLLQLLPKEFVNDQSIKYGIGNIHPFELLVKIIEGRGRPQLRTLIVNSSGQIFKTIIDYMVSMQTHYALYIYATKRYTFLKHFLLHDLRAEKSLKGIDPLNLRMIVAGYYASNEQIRPSDELIANLTQESLYNSPDTISAEKALLDQFAPKTLDDIIEQVRTMLKKVADPSADIDDLFSEIRQLSEDEGFLAKLEAGFLELVKQGALVASMVLQEVTALFQSHAKLRKAAIARRQSGIIKAITENEELKIERIPKESAVLEEGIKLYELVATDKVGFRGGRGRTILRDYADCFALFEENEETIFNFKRAFFTLFEYLRERDVTENVILIEINNPDGRPQPYHEFYIAFKIPNLDQAAMQGLPHLLCLGLTFFPRPSRFDESRAPEPPPADETYEADSDPYAILFQGHHSAEGAGRSASRRIKGTNRKYHQIPIFPPRRPLVYRALYEILHLLPAQGETHWYAPSVQHSLRFLLKHLR